MDYENPLSGTLVAGLSDPADSILLRLLRAPIPENIVPLSWADLLEANFDGYLPVRILDYDEVDESVEGVGEVLSQPLSFTAGENVTCQACYGYAITQQVGVGPISLVDVVAFPEPEVFFEPGHTIQLVVRVNAVNDPV